MFRADKYVHRADARDRPAPHIATSHDRLLPPIGRDIELAEVRQRAIEIDRIQKAANDSLRSSYAQTATKAGVAACRMTMPSRPDASFLRGRGPHRGVARGADGGARATGAPRGFLSSGLRLFSHFRLRPASGPDRRRKSSSGTPKEFRAQHHSGRGGSAPAWCSIAKRSGTPQCSTSLPFSNRQISITVMEKALAANIAAIVP
jgi:hypothetical protein